MTWRNLWFSANVEITEHATDKHTDLIICIILCVAYILKTKSYLDAMPFRLWPGISSSFVEQIVSKFCMEDLNQKLLRSSDV
jgi:hypothetical protein